MTEKMPRRRIQAYFKQLSESEKSYIIVLKEAGWADWIIAHHMGQSNAAIIR